MKIIRKIWSAFQSIEVLAAIAVTLVIMLPIAMGMSPYVVKSGSMEPTIQTGALAFVRKGAYESAKVKKGDIVTFAASKTTTVTHRIFKDNGDGTYQTKGDNNDVKDSGALDRRNIIGKYAFSVPYLGYAAAEARTKRGICVIAFVIIANVFVSILLSDSEAFKKEPEEE